MVQAADRQAKRPNWMYAASLASRGDPNSSDLGSALSHLPHSITQSQNVQPLVFKLSVPMFFTLFSYPALHRPPLPSPPPSLSITQCDCTQHTAHAPTRNTLSVGVQQRLNLSVHLLGKFCRCAKGYNNRYRFCNQLSSPGDCH